MEKVETKLRLPALKKPSGSLAVKKDDKPVKTFSISSVQKQGALGNILKGESIKQKMHKEQQAHKGLDLVLMGDLTGSMSAYHAILKRKFTRCGRACSRGRNPRWKWW